uniref:Uncharacterized protein n=1 Tax=Arundo donax TaxID=35708 RepID=A0A0A9AWL5_ARUDO
MPSLAGIRSDYRRWEAIGSRGRGRVCRRREQGDGIERGRIERGQEGQGMDWQGGNGRNWDC